MQSSALPNYAEFDSRRRLSMPSYVDIVVIFIVIFIMFYFLKMLMRMSAAQTA